MRTKAAGSGILVLLAIALLAQQAVAESKAYTKSAGESAPMVEVERKVVDDDGTIRTEMVRRKPVADKWGNANGNDHDLAVDGAFEGQTVAVIQLYTMDFDFSLPKQALKEKGFSVYRWSNAVPSPRELETALAKSSQLWLISGETRLLTDEHAKVIKKFFDAGHGVYIWGDNQPYYADANFLAEALLGANMEGNLNGDQVVTMQKRPGAVGVRPNHLLTTGLENIYEGITIATIQPRASGLEPLIYGSAGNLVTAFYDRGGKRAILDGGFTRLYIKWDTAGTARYVKNAAAWLVNAERFGDAVVSAKIAGAKPVTSVPAMITPAGTSPRTAPTTETQYSLDAVLPPVIFMLLGLLAGCSLLVLAIPRLRRS